MTEFSPPDLAQTVNSDIIAPTTAPAEVLDKPSPVAMLGNIAVIGGNAVVDFSDRQFESREALLFEAFPLSDIVSEKKEFDFHSIWGSDDEYKNTIDSVKVSSLTASQLLEQEFIKRGQVTTESVNAARPNFRSIISDLVVAEAISEYKKAHPGVFIEDDLMKALREDTQLRLSVGTRLLEVSEAHPFAVSSEKIKNSQHPGYRHIKNMRSQEYVALLALAMADGTYKDPGKSMGQQHSRLMEVTNGRHRSAARAVLEGRQNWDKWIAGRNRIETTI